MSKEYKIRTIEDIIVQIPSDKLDRFLHEMCDGLKQAKAMYDLYGTVAELMGEEPAKMTDGFTWVDDDKESASVTVSMIDENGKGISIKSNVPEQA